MSMEWRGGNHIVPDEYRDDARDEPELVRKLCPDCPDGQVWNAQGPTGEICETCGGSAFVWVEAPEDKS